MTILSDIGTLVGQELKALSTTTVSPVYTLATMPTSGTNGQTAIISDGVGSSQTLAYLWNGEWYAVTDNNILVRPSDTGSTTDNQPEFTNSDIGREIVFSDLTNLGNWNLTIGTLYTTTQVNNEGTRIGIIDNDGTFVWLDDSTRPFGRQRGVHWNFNTDNTDTGSTTDNTDTGSTTDNTDTLNLPFADLQLNAYTVDADSTVGTGDTVRLMTTFTTFTTGIVLRVASVSNSVITVETPDGNVEVSGDRGTQWEKVLVSILHSNRVITQELRFSEHYTGTANFDGYYAEFDSVERSWYNNGYNDQYLMSTPASTAYTILVKVANKNCTTNFPPTFLIQTTEVTPGVSQAVRQRRYIGGQDIIVPAPVQSFYANSTNNPQGLLLNDGGVTLFNASSDVCDT